MDYTKRKQIEFRRKFFKIMGAEIVMTDAMTQEEVGFIKMKAWKLKEDIRLFSNRDQQQEIVRIGARKVMDFNATYDIFDSASDKLMFSLQRKALRSAFVRDRWDISDANGGAMGFVEETSGNLALIRRWIELIPVVGAISIVFAFIPQTYTINVNSEETSTVILRKNPFIVKFGLSLSEGSKVDPKISVAAVALMSVIDAGKD